MYMYQLPVMLDARGRASVIFTFNVFPLAQQKLIEKHKFTVKIFGLLYIYILNFCYFSGAVLVIRKTTVNKGVSFPLRIFYLGTQSLSNSQNKYVSCEIVENTIEKVMLSKRNKRYGLWEVKVILTRRVIVDFTDQETLGRDLKDSRNRPCRCAVFFIPHISMDF